MFEELLTHLTTAPLAVIMIVYIWISDKQKTKVLDGYKSIIEQNKQTTDKLIDLVEELTRKK